MSPENVSQSFFMYRQARHVCEAQKQGNEDKLSVKNLIFHSVKNAIATLERSKESSDDNLEKPDDDDEEEDEEMWFLNYDDLFRNLCMISNSS